MGSTTPTPTGLLPPYRLPAAATAQAVAAPPRAGADPSGSVPVRPEPRPAARRGSLEEALRVAGSDELMKAALLDLERDRYAETSTRSRASLLRTWGKIHQAAFQRDPNPPAPFPLSCESIRRIAALFKAGGYMSFENYAMRAKSEHLSLQLHGHGSWSMELNAALTGAIRSVNRGVGVSRQSEPLDAIAVAKLELSEQPLVAGGPVAPVDFAVAGTFFLLRAEKRAVSDSFKVGPSR